MIHYHGVLMGGIAFILIGVFHPIVIKCEYYFGKRCWPAFLAVGIFFIIVSLVLESTYGSVAFGITGFCCLWSIKELREQEERVRRGWFPKNPKRLDDYQSLREAE